MVVIWSGYSKNSRFSFSLSLCRSDSVLSDSQANKSFFPLFLTIRKIGNTHYPPLFFSIIQNSFFVANLFFLSNTNQCIRTNISLHNKKKRNLKELCSVWIDWNLALDLKEGRRTFEQASAVFVRRAKQIVFVLQQTHTDVRDRNRILLPQSRFHLSPRTHFLFNYMCSLLTHQQRQHFLTAWTCWDSNCVSVCKE